MLVGSVFTDYHNSKNTQNIVNMIHKAEAGKRIRWGFFPDSSTIEIRFSNNIVPSCTVKDNVISIRPMTNSVFCEVKLLSSTGL